MYLPATNTEVLKSQINQHEIRIQKTITQAHHQKRFGTKEFGVIGIRCAGKIKTVLSS